MGDRSKLLRVSLRNLGCVGSDNIDIPLDNIVCLVGKNNAGKSTILRAYELARGAADFDPDLDRCKWANPEEPSEVILDVHIPQGLANVDEKWKTPTGDLLIVRSRWQWSPPEFKRTRTTWDPSTANWAEDTKAGGADPVFNSRLPRPLRIGSLQDANASEELLLTLALDPFIRDMKGLESNPNSELSQSVGALVELVKGLTRSHEERFSSIAAKVEGGFESVFPGLKVRLDVSMAKPSFKIDTLIKQGSGIRINDARTEVKLAQQGTGARRALFWSMLQVHNQLSRDTERRKTIADTLAKEEKRKEKADKKLMDDLKSQLEQIDSGKGFPPEADDPAFPGYLLLIDEPENALHPMAARAAQRHLYNLSLDPEWQVILTTHSPYFVNPLANHTTIIRLERKDEPDGQVSTRTYSADAVGFGEDEKRRLQAIQQMDVGFSEVFFGSYPIIVEGDTEHAAFLSAVLEEEHDLADVVTVLRARGKAIIPALIRMLRHFGIPFGVIHDCDWPYRADGSANGMWSTNGTIFDEIRKAREANVDVRHRCSIPDFERLLGGPELDKEKPLAAYDLVKSDAKSKRRVQALIGDLVNSADPYPLGFVGGTREEFLTCLLSELSSWAIAHGAANDIRLIGKQT